MEGMDEYTRPDPTRAALLTIDVQNDFTLRDAPAAVPGTTDAVGHMQRVVEAFRDANRPIVHVVRLYRSDGSNVDLCRRTAIEEGTTIVQPGTDGAELVSALKPDLGVSLDCDALLAGELQRVGKREWVMYKPRWSAFYRTPLDDHLTDRGVNTVVICGCNFPNCPRATMYDASAREYRLVFVPDATSKTYARGIEEFENIMVAVMNADDTADWIG